MEIGLRRPHPRPVADAAVETRSRRQELREASLRFVDVVVDARSHSLSTPAGQLYAMSSGRPLKHVAADVVEHMLHQIKNPPRFSEKPTYEVHFDALKRR
jgi:hypothetical protein